MKNYLTILTVGLMISTGAFAQGHSELEVPEAVKSAFFQKFPAAKKVSWDMESGTEWEAEFKLKGNKYSANFLADGTWQETEHKIKKAAIPEVTKQTLAKDFSGYKIVGAEISERTNGSACEVVVEKREEEWELVFDRNGKLVEKKAIAGDED